MTETTPLASRIPSRPLTSAAHFRRRGLMGALRVENVSRHEEEAGEDAYDRAMDAHSDGDYARAVLLWKEAIRLGYRSGAATYNLACSLARSGDVSAAIDALERAVDEGFDL